MRLSVIAAVSDNGVIGRGNDLPWHLPRDLKRFKRLTTGHHLLIGRKTFESIGRVLPGRTTIVLTRGQSRLPEGVLAADSLASAIAIARAASDPEPFVGGGEQIYRQALPLAGRLYLTRVHSLVDGDARFPALDLERWMETAREHYPVSDENSIALTFQVLTKRQGPTSEAPVQLLQNANDR